MMTTWELTYFIAESLEPESPDTLKFKDPFRIKGRLLKDGLPAPADTVILIIARHEDDDTDWDDWSTLKFHYGMTDSNGDGYFSETIYNVEGSEKTLNKYGSWTFRPVKGAQVLSNSDSLQMDSREAIFFFKDKPKEVWLPDEHGQFVWWLKDADTFEIIEGMVCGYHRVNEGSYYWKSSANPTTRSFTAEDPIGYETLEWVYVGDNAYARNDSARIFHSDWGTFPDDTRDKLYIQIGEPTSLELIDIGDKYWGTTVKPAGILKDSDDNPIGNAPIIFDIDTPTGPLETKTAYTNSSGIAEYPDTITQEVAWIDGRVTVDIDYLLDRERGRVIDGRLIPYVANSDTEEYNVKKREPDLTSEVPQYKPDGGSWTGPYSKNELAGLGLPIGYTVKLKYTLEDTIDESGLEGWTITLSFSGEGVIKDDVDLTATDSNGETTYDWLLESPPVTWTVTASTSPPVSVEDKYIDAGNSITAVVGPSYTEITYDGPTTVKPDVENIYKFRLMDKGEDEPIAGEHITLTIDYTAHPDSPQTTDYTGWVEYHHTFAEADIGTHTLTAGFAPEDSDYATATKVVEVTVEKKDTSISIDGPDTLEIESIGEWSGELIDVDTSTGIAAQNIRVSKNGEEDWQIIPTDENGQYTFEWRPTVEELGNWTITVNYDGDTEYESCTNNTAVTIEKKTGSITYSINHVEPVPEADMVIEGYLLEEQMEEKGDEVISLYKNSDLIMSTLTSNEDWNRGYFKLEFSAPMTLGEYTYKIKWEGDEEWKAIEETEDIEVKKEIPSVVLSVPDTVIEEADFIVGVAFLSFNGGVVEGLKPSVYDVDEVPPMVIQELDLDADGIDRITERVQCGTHNWGLGFDGNYQLNSIDPTTQSKSFKAITKPDLSRPKFQVKIYDSDDVEKGTISPLDKISSLQLNRNIAPEADSYSIKLDNKDSYYSDKTERGDRVSIYLGYEPIVWTDTPLALRGIVEDTERSLTSKGELYTIKGQDYMLYLKNAIVDKQYRDKTPYYVLTDSTENIFKEAGLDDDFNFEIVAPKGWSDRGYFTFDGKSVLDCIKDIKDRCEKSGVEYEFFVKSDATKPIFILRPKLASPLSSEVLEIGKNVSTIRITDEISPVRNKIRVRGAKLPTEQTDKFDWYPDGAEGEQYLISGTTFYLTYGDIIQVSFLAIDGVKKEEGVDYTLDSLVGTINLTEEPKEGVEVEVNYKYRKRIECVGGELTEGYSPTTGWWTDTNSINNVTWGKPRELSITTELEDVVELDSIAKALLLEYRDPVQYSKISTRGLFLSEAGYDVKIIYSDEGINEYQKIATLNQAFSKTKGFVSNVDLQEISPSIGSVISKIIGGDIWFRID